MAQPSPAEKTRTRDPVARFHELYQQAVADARVSEETTATEGWAKVYLGQRKAEREERRRISDSLRFVSELVGSGATDDELQKTVGDAKKDLAALAEGCAAFDRQTVEPVREPVERARNIIAEAMSAAQNEAERTPLVSRGLVDEMQAAIRSVPEIVWDEGKGRVRVVERDGRRGAV